MKMTKKHHCALAEMRLIFPRISNLVLKIDFCITDATYKHEIGVKQTVIQCKMTI